MADRSQVSPRTVWTIGVHVAGMVGVVVLLRATWMVVAWTLIAVFVALALLPAVRFLERRGLRRGLAVFLVVILSVAVLTGVGSSFVPMVADQAQRFAQDAPGLIGRLRELPPVAWISERVDIVEPLRTAASRLGPAALGSAFDVVRTVLEGVAGTMTVSVLAVFMLLFGDDILDGALEWVHPTEHEQVRGLIREITTKVGGYVSGTLFVASIGAVVAVVSLVALGVPYYLPLGLAMLVLGVIPYLGSLIAAILIVGTTLLTVGVKSGVIALVIFLVYQRVENDLLQPLVQRRTIQMNPLIIALVLLFGTALAGVLGALLALPIACGVQVLLQHSLRRRREAWPDA